MPNILFVAPYYGANTLHALRSLACTTNVELGIITQEHAGRLPDELRLRGASLIHVDNAQDPGELVRAARRFEQRRGRIHRIESHLEQMQVPVAEVRSALNIPGVSANDAHNFRDKHRMKRVLHDAQVPVARQQLVRSAADARQFADDVGFPIVLKPLAGQGAEDTIRATDDLSLSAALNVLLPTEASPAQAEEFIQGEEHTCETVMIDGRSVWSSSVHYLPSPLQVAENSWMQYCLLLPREEADSRLKDIRPINEQALLALGMREGLSHMEWFRRKDGSVVVSEVGARPPGANIMTMLSAAHDVDSLAVLAHLTAHQQWNMPQRKFAAGCVFLRAMGGSSTVRDVKGSQALKQQLGHSIVEARLPKPGQPRSEHYEGDGYVLIRHPETQGVVAAMRKVLETVRVL